MTNPFRNMNLESGNMGIPSLMIKHVLPIWPIGAWKS